MKPKKSTILMPYHFSALGSMQGAEESLRRAMQHGFDAQYSGNLMTQMSKALAALEWAQKVAKDENEEP